MSSFRRVSVAYAVYMMPDVYAASFSPLLPRRAMRKKMMPAEDCYADSFIGARQRAIARFLLINYYFRFIYFAAISAILFSLLFRFRSFSREVYAAAYYACLMPPHLFR